MYCRLKDPETGFSPMQSGHISDDDMDRYLLDRIQNEAELATLEEHLLVCASCTGRAMETQELIQALRDATGSASRGDPTVKPFVCLERRKLERDLVAAVEAVFKASNEDRGAANLAEIEAVSALEAHIVRHGCEDQGRLSKKPQ